MSKKKEKATKKNRATTLHSQNNEFRSPTSPKRVSIVFLVLPRNKNREHQSQLQYLTLFVEARIAQFRHLDPALLINLNFIKKYKPKAMLVPLDKLRVLYD